ncbi:conserved hypothetical protein [Rippkaea orientalis PCC 8801]|uniref:DUF6671 domain-containing protein n=1 Tax=Rippkaea orientalis (strain PCC 8801 / RF-1) TaxID=41431 RepID=B7K0U2_RIPO1|nr:DUF6671 family protein [Rippkaea orientalis]ACK65083.1 conserved hypothetical protein [Rippkaea orientalis PCC 8801]
MVEIKSWFENRVCLVATMHKKEQVISPPIEQELGVKVVVPQAFNTDNFGTFTREIKRLGTQLEAARLKAQKALEMTGESLVITSEGSFFPHPTLPYAACDRELIFFFDQVNQIEIVAQEISLETNYSHASIRTIDEGLQFAQKVDFPSHGLIVMPNSEAEKNDPIFKGIVTENDLFNAIKTVLEFSPKKIVHIETDMRAMYNPTRMKVIAKATQNLIDKIFNTCPNCHCPGFDVVEHKSGLPCGLCGFPTDLIHSEIYRCQKCQLQQIKSFPNGQKSADPMYCNYCNP